MLQWVGGLGDGWLEPAGIVFYWVTVGGITGHGCLETAVRVL